MSITLFKNDYNTPITISAKTQGNIIPLIGSKVFFEFTCKKRNEQVGGGECEVVDPVKGVAQYKFKEGELQVAGEYQGVFVIDLAQGANRKSIALNFKIIGDENE